MSWSRPTATSGRARAIYDLGAAVYGQGLRDKVQDIPAQLRKADSTLAGQFAKRYAKS